MMKVSTGTCRTFSRTMSEKPDTREKGEFHYRGKPAVISFLFFYLICVGSSYLLIDNSPAISGEIQEKLIEPLDINLPPLLLNSPLGVLLSLPFLVSGLRKLLWNVMSSYEFTAQEIRLITGSMSRKERFFPVADFFQVSFRQNVIEAPFGVGSLILTSAGTGKRLTIKGVYRVKDTADALRPGLGASF